MQRQYVIAGTIVAALAALGGFAVWKSGLFGDAATPVATEPPSNAAPAPVATHVGAAVCGECHADEYQRWRASQHAIAMQVADEQTVLGDFSGVKFRNRGVTSEFFRRDGKFMVRTDGPDG